MNKERQWLFDKAMEHMDAAYSEKAGMLERSWGSRTFCDMRGSAHYAAGLMVRRSAGDVPRALRILDRILKAQFTADPAMDWYGGFPQDPEQPAPPAEPFTAAHFDAVSRYYLEKWQESIRGRFRRHLAERSYSGEQIQEIEDLLRTSRNETIPVVWNNWDANWREFIPTELAMILTWGADVLPEAYAKRIDEAGAMAVEGSIRRWQDHVIPMNTNVELLHVFICGFYGQRLKERTFAEHARLAAADILARYRETDSFAEYNSTTYCSVDLMALAMWRLYLEDERLRGIGAELEEGLWRNIAEMYHPGLHQVCGPFARNYDNDMALHSMLPAYLYILFDDAEPKPVLNVETESFVDVAVNGTRIPEDVSDMLRRYTGPRTVRRTFRELMERGRPGDDTTLCTVTATIEECWMLGAMSGSRNTSGQLHSAVGFWKCPDGSTGDFLLLRRMPGRREGEHLWTVCFDGEVTGNRLRMAVSPQTDRDIEVFFEIHAPGLTADMFEERAWHLPGMEIGLETDGGRPLVRLLNERTAQVIYAWHYPADAGHQLHFDLEMKP